MRVVVNLPDQLVSDAELAAKLDGVSFETFLVDSLARRLEEGGDEHEADFFTPSRIAEIQAAAIEARDGTGIGIEEYRKQRLVQREAWKESPDA